MSTSPHEHPEDKYSNITEGDFAERPEQEGRQSSATKILWIVGILVLGVVGVYVVVTFFSIGVQSLFDGPNPAPPSQKTQTPTQEAQPNAPNGVPAPLPPGTPGENEPPGR